MFLTAQRHDMVSVHTSNNSNFQFGRQPSSHAGIIVEHEGLFAIPRRLLSVQFTAWTMESMLKRVQTFCCFVPPY